MTPAGLLDELESLVVGKRRQAVWMLLALVAEGHVLIEDVPGVAKTRLAQAMAKILDLTYARIQATPDLLPSDITGGLIYDPASRAMEFRAGPVFRQLVLVDEVNRATPRTQSALLESMEERQVSADGVTRALPNPFFVVATANPVEMSGTFPLPEAQKDRFLLSFAMGYPELADERDMVRRFVMDDPLANVQPSLDAEDILRWRDEARAVRVSGPVLDYVVDLARESRRHPGIVLGASPRAVVQWVRAIKAYAWIAGRHYATPDDVQTLMPVVLGHRLVLQGGVRGTAFHERQQSVHQVLSEIIAGVSVPIESVP